MVEITKSSKTYIDMGTREEDPIPWVDRIKVFVENLGRVSCIDHKNVVDSPTVVVRELGMGVIVISMILKWIGINF